MKSHWKRIVVGGLLSFVMLGNAAFAGQNINQRQKNQQQRIAKGVQSGQLTPHETVRLEKETIPDREERSKSQIGRQFYAAGTRQNSAGAKPLQPRPQTETRQRGSTLI
ncbi:MAG: hypothetical protein U0V70_13640 [Terriglobia bacterium]